MNYIINYVIKKRPFSSHLKKQHLNRDYLNLETIVNREKISSHLKEYDYSLNMWYQSSLWVTSKDSPLDLLSILQAQEERIDQGWLGPPERQQLVLIHVHWRPRHSHYPLAKISPFWMPVWGCHPLPLALGGLTLYLCWTSDWRKSCGQGRNQCVMKVFLKNKVS